MLEHRAVGISSSSLATHSVLAGSIIMHGSLSQEHVVVKLRHAAERRTPGRQVYSHLNHRTNIVVEQGKFGQVALLNGKPRIGMYNLGEALAGAADGIAEIASQHEG